MYNGFEQRTLFIHRKPAKDDGVIRINAKDYLFHWRQGNLSDRKMKVWVRELPADLYTLNERLMVYSEPKSTDETFMGFADYYPDVF